MIHNKEKSPKTKVRQLSTSLSVSKELLIIAVTLQLLLEILGHQSIIHGLMTPLINPLMFFCNIFLLSCFLSFSLLLPKRVFGYILVSTIWLLLGITNYIVLSFRTTPFTATDIKILSSVFSILNHYVSPFQVILIVLSLLFTFSSLIYLGIKLPLTKIYIGRSIVTIFMCVILLIGSYNAAVKGNAVSSNFGNIATAFLDYGFAYSFSISVIDKGIKRPKSYSMDTVDEVLDLLSEEENNVVENPTSPIIIKDEHLALDTIFDDYLVRRALIQHSNKTNTTPNIVLVQLESFFNVNRFKGLTFNTNPLPNMTKLIESYSSGYVTVPYIGAGTANTEFEILSGMNLDYFGAGEYPYDTILTESTVESLPYALTELGYHNHAIHNNIGIFYSRDSVYPKLGFDSFSSIEYMDNIEYNPLKWAKDKVLIPEITKALQATPAQDFIFVISVQAHGEYPDESILDNPVILPSIGVQIPAMTYNDNDTSLEDKTDISTLPPSQEPVEVQTYNKYLYYVNQIYETDAFIGDLIQRLEFYPEPLLIIFYGDHMPSLDITKEDLKDGTPFQMDYVIWDNMGLVKTDHDLMAYQMGSYIMERLAYKNGLLNRFHQLMKDSENYEEELQLLQYDMLYGDKNVYGGVNPFIEKEMTMGIIPIFIKDVQNRGEAIIVSGQNFTLWSEVFINNEQVDTVFLDSQTLLVPHANVLPNITINVSQVSENSKVLSQTDSWTNKAEESSHH